MKKLQSTSERTNVGRGRNNSQGNRSRVTISSGDYIDSGTTLGRRNVSCPRQSTISQNAADTCRRVDSDNNLNELSLLYDKYLRGKLELMIVEEKCRARQKELFHGIAAMAKMYEESVQKLNDVKMRESEVIDIIAIQKSMDTDIEEMTAALKTYQGKPFDILSIIKSLISDLDVLICQDIMIPQNKEEIQEFQLCLEKSINLTKSLNQRIDNKSLTVSSGRRIIEEFTESHRILNEKLKILEESLNDLQIQVLEKTSNNLARSL